MWREEDEEDVNSYWITLRKGDNTGNGKWKHYIALCGELALDDTTDLFQTDCGMNEWMVKEIKQRVAC